MAAESAHSTRPHTPTHSAGQKAEHKRDRAARGNQDVDESKLLHGRELAFTFAAMLLSIFLVALDQTILAPALPVIASHFNSLRQSAWVVSAFILTQASFLLAYGQILMMYDQKIVFLSSIGIFEIGSLICAVAPNIDVLIFGRALAGVGAGGIFVAMISLIAVITTLQQRPLLMGLFGGIFGVSSVIAPVIGGLFTQHVSWRWCFYINLPIGGLAAAVSLWRLPRAPPPPFKDDQKETIRARWAFVSGGKFQPEEDSWLFTIMLFDVVGAFLLLATVVCLLLALVWGGNDYPWKSAPVIVCFVLSGVLCGVTIAWEHFCAGAAPVIPLRFFTHKTIVGCSIVGFCQFFAMFLLNYYDPLLFEAVNNDSPTNAGLKTLPFIGTFIVLAITSGAIVKKKGRYWPFMVIAPVFLCVGAGLLFTLDASSPYAKNAGFQVIYGLGIGPVFQNVFLAVQANVHPRDIPQGTGAVSLFQRLGGSVGISIAGAVLNQQLRKEFDRYAPTANYELLSQSVQAVWDESITSLAIRSQVIVAYGAAIPYVFIIGVPLGGISILGALLIANTDIRRKEDKPTNSPRSSLSEETAIDGVPKQSTAGSGEEKAPHQVNEMASSMEMGTVEVAEKVSAKASEAK